MNRLLEALKTIAEFPKTRTDELGYERCREIARKALSDFESQPSGWISVKERLPDIGQKVIVFFQNELGFPRRAMANFIPKYSMRADDMAWDDTDSDFFDEKDGVEYVPEGWWEDTITSEITKLLEEPITHWMPLPKPPEAG